MASIIARENLIWVIGDSFRRRIVLDTDVDLSTYTARLQARSEAGATDLVIGLSTAAGEHLTMGANYVDIDVPASVVPDLAAVSRYDRLTESADDCSAASSGYGKVAPYDLLLISDDVVPEKFTPLAGEIVFVERVTTDA